MYHSLHAFFLFFQLLGMQCAQKNNSFDLAKSDICVECGSASDSFVGGWTGHDPNRFYSGVEGVKEMKWCKNIRRIWMVLRRVDCAYLERAKTHPWIAMLLKFPGVT